MSVVSRKQITNLEILPHTQHLVPSDSPRVVEVHWSVLWILGEKSIKISDTNLFLLFQVFLTSYNAEIEKMRMEIILLKCVSERFNICEWLFSMFPSEVIYLKKNKMWKWLVGWPVTSSSSWQPPWPTSPTSPTTRWRSLVGRFQTKLCKVRGRRMFIYINLSLSMPSSSSYYRLFIKHIIQIGNRGQSKIWGVLPKMMAKIKPETWQIDKIGHKVGLWLAKWTFIVILLARS